MSTEEFKLLLGLGHEDARAAVHECGHAIVQWESPFALRGSTLSLKGLQSQFRFKASRQKTVDRSWDLLMIELGGLAAEYVAECPYIERRRSADFLGKAREISTELALGARWNKLPPPSWVVPTETLDIPPFFTDLPLESESSKYLGMGFSLASNLLRNRKLDLLTLAALLMERGTLRGYHLRRVLGPRRIDRPIPDKVLQAAIH